MTRRLAQLHRRRAELAEQLAAVDRAIAETYARQAGEDSTPANDQAQLTELDRAAVVRLARQKGIRLE